MTDSPEVLSCLGFAEHRVIWIDAAGIGSRLLERMGWKPGTGLGRAEQGVVEPLVPGCRPNKLGLGA